MQKLLWETINQVFVIKNQDKSSVILRGCCSDQEEKEGLKEEVPCESKDNIVTKWMEVRMNRCPVGQKGGLERA